MYQRVDRDDEMEQMESITEESLFATPISEKNHLKGSSSSYMEYLRKIPLLSHEEEIYHGRMMEESREKIAVLVFSTRCSLMEMVAMLESYLSGKVCLARLIGHHSLETKERSKYDCVFREAMERIESYLSNPVFSKSESDLLVEYLSGIGFGADFLLDLGRSVLERGKDLFKAYRNLEYFKMCSLESSSLKSGHYLSLSQRYDEELSKLCYRLDELPLYFVHYAEASKALKVYERSRSTMIRSNLRLVLAYVTRNIPRLSRLNFFDLVQEGNIGLIRAVEKYDYRHGHKFSTYAVWWIKQAVCRAIADQCRIIRLPLNILEIVGRIQRLNREYQSRYGRVATVQEISENLEISEEEVLQYLQSSKTPVSLDNPFNDDDYVFSDYIEDPNALSPMDYLRELNIQEHVRMMLSTLNEREARVLCLRYGIGEDCDHTLEEVGQEFSLTRERIRQIEMRSMEKIRKVHSIHKRKGGCL